MGKIVSIHSFRGGTGKSNVTANLAAQVAMQGKRVGIVDTDIASPGIHVLFGLSDDTMGHTMNEFLRGECSIVDAAYAIGEADHDLPGISHLKGKSIYLVPSSIKGSEISDFLRNGYDPNLLNNGLHQLVKELNLDYLFIDTHPGINEETLLSISISDVLVLIMRPDNQDFQGTSVVVDIANLLYVDNTLLLVNKALSKYDSGALQSDIESLFGTTVPAVLPLSEDMVENASADIFTLSFPDHKWSVGLKKVVDAILTL